MCQLFLCRFLNVLGAEDMELHQAFIMYPPLEAEFNKAAENFSHIHMVPDVKNLITRKDEFKSSCLNFTKDERWAFQFPLWHVSMQKKMNN